jgi:hypothetical protein
MLETSDFFQVQVKVQTKKCQVQIKKCESLAAGAIDKSEREFWLQLAHRWEDQLRVRQCGGSGAENATGTEVVCPDLERHSAA